MVKNLPRELKTEESFLAQGHDLCAINMRGAHKCHEPLVTAIEQTDTQFSVRTSQRIS